jgi:hypothetical protein
VATSSVAPPVWLTSCIFSPRASGKGKASASASQLIEKRKIVICFNMIPPPFTHKITIRQQSALRRPEPCPNDSRAAPKDGMGNQSTVNKDTGKVKLFHKEAIGGKQAKKKSLVTRCIISEKGFKIKIAMSKK